MFRRKDQCHKVREMLSSYIDSKLPSSQSQMVEGHVAECEACRRELESLRATVNLLHRVPVISPPRSFALAAVEPRRRPAPFALVGAATAIAVLLLAFLFLGDALNLFGPGLLGGEEALPTYQVMDAGREPAAGVAGGWPMWQLEVTFIVVTAILAGATVFLWRRRRRAKPDQEF